MVKDEPTNDFPEVANFPITSCNFIKGQLYRIMTVVPEPLTLLYLAAMGLE